MTTSRRAFLLRGLVGVAGTARFIGGGAAAMLAVAQGGCATPPPADDDDGAPAHPLAGIADFDGAPLPPPALAGKVVVLDFWASWCAPCRIAFPRLDQLYRTFVAEGLIVMAVSVDDDPLSGRRFAAMLRPRFPVAWDPSGAVRERFGVAGLPTTLLLDEAGQLVMRTEGFDPAQHRNLEDHVRRLLRGA